MDFLRNNLQSCNYPLFIEFKEISKNTSYNNKNIINIETTSYLPQMIQ